MDAAFASLIERSKALDGRISNITAVFARLEEQAKAHDARISTIEKKLDWILNTTILTLLSAVGALVMLVVKH